MGTLGKVNIENMDYEKESSVSVGFWIEWLHQNAPHRKGFQPLWAHYAGACTPPHDI